MPITPRDAGLELVRPPTVATNLAEVGDLLDAADRLGLIVELATELEATEAGARYVPRLYWPNVEHHATTDTDPEDG
jgi:hypothetical protein